MIMIIKAMHIHTEKILAWSQLERFKDMVKRIKTRGKVNNMVMIGMKAQIKTWTLIARDWKHT